jgi:glutamate-1-semialdehyde 2,1-aminomutase
MSLTSSDWFARAKLCLPGGVNSPVRAFKSVGGEPLFFERGEGACLYDVEGQSYIDYVGSWGPLILGHAHPEVISVVKSTIEKGMSFGAPSPLEVLLAEKIMSIYPSIEKIRMVSSGTEATMTAIRLARGFTGRKKLIKFNGCYHGHSDSLLVKAGSGVLTLGIPSTHGVLDEIAAHTLTVEFNDLDAVKTLFTLFPDDIAGIIVEPIAGNMGMVLPVEGFLSGLKQLADQYGALLIFDEVMTGCRVHLSGAQGLYGISPDITTLGKVIGGGMPVGAIGGRADILSSLSPEGGIYQAGTLSGNPVAMASGLATLSLIEKVGFFDDLQLKTTQLITGLAKVCEMLSIPFVGTAVGGMFGFCFHSIPNIRHFEDVAASDKALFNAFYHGMLKEGVYFAPSLFEAGFVSSAHTTQHIENTIAKSMEVLKKLKSN